MVSVGNCHSVKIHYIPLIIKPSMSCTCGDKYGGNTRSKVITNEVGEFVLWISSSHCLAVSNEQNEQQPEKREGVGGREREREILESFP